MHKRKRTKAVRAGNICIGGGAPVSIQSMTNTNTADTNKTLDQINRIYQTGGELVRVAVPDEAALEALPVLVSESPLPLIADIHFRHDLAIKSLEKGVAKVRINPGNLGGIENYIEVIKKAKEVGAPIRIGVNAGSLEKEIKKQYGGVTAEAMVESALRYVRVAEEEGFDRLVISLKASGVPASVDAYELISKKVDYPLHIGITEAGSWMRGSIKSAVGIGSLLMKGIGDTLRVSLSSPPEKEVEVARIILQSLELRKFGPDIISCPTCGRTQIEVTELVEKVEELVKHSSSPIRIAVMGCPVNGPGEAREADIGISGTSHHGVIFKSGEIVKRVSREELLEAFKSELDRI